MLPRNSIDRDIWRWFLAGQGSWKIAETMNLDEAFVANRLHAIREERRAQAIEREFEAMRRQREREAQKKTLVAHKRDIRLEDLGDAINRLARGREARRPSRH